MHAHREVSLFEKVVIDATLDFLQFLAHIICLNELRGKNTFIAWQFIQCNDSQFI